MGSKSSWTIFPKASDTEKENAKGIPTLIAK